MSLTLRGITCIGLFAVSAATAMSDVASGIFLAQAQRSDTTVRTAGAPVYPGVATLRDGISIGRAEGPEEYLIVAPQALAFGYDGSVYLADRGVAGGGSLGPLASIRQYDSTGKFIRRIGRGGMGPGEYRAFSGMHAIAGGRLMVYDGSAGRILVFSRTGTVDTSWRAPTGIGSTGFFADSNGNAYIRARLTPVSGGTFAPSAFVHFDVNGNMLDTIHEPPRPEMPNGRMDATQGRSTMSLGVPFMPSFRFGFSPLGYYITARTDRYAIDLNLPTRTGQTTTPWKPGSPVVSIRRTMQAVPVSAEERRLWRDSTESRGRRFQSDWRWTGPEIPRNKPYFLQLGADLDGKIWARVADSSEKITPEMDMDDEAVNYWDVFEPNARYLGRVRTGPGVLPAFTRGDRMLTLVRDANDVPKIVVARIAWGGR